MKIKKFIASLVVSTIILGIPVNAFAHGHSKSTSKLGYCSIDGCTLTGTHKHNNKSYLAHYEGDGHNHSGLHH